MSTTLSQDRIARVHLITVRPLGDLFTGFEIMAGERRFLAISQVLGWDTIPAIVRELDDEAASAIMLAENTGRAGLNPIEEAQAYQSRIERFDWTPGQIADIAGVSTDLVRHQDLPHPPFQRDNATEDAAPFSPGRPRAPCLHRRRRVAPPPGRS